MAKRKRKNNLVGNDVSKLSAKNRKPVAHAYTTGLSIPREGSIWRSLKDEMLYEVFSTPQAIAVQGYLTLSDTNGDKIDMFITEFYANFSLWKNNIPSKLETK